MRKQRSHEPGETFKCVTCGKEFFRQAWRIRKGQTEYCSNACVGLNHKGENNPFWNRKHSDETRKKISENRKGKNIGNKNASGYHHTEEARKRIAEASREMWRLHRDKMLEALPRGEAHIYHKPPELRRHRKQFSPRQRREWTGTMCAYCGTTEHLELDHIIPIFDGGSNHRQNAQTLCRGCNLFKSWFVDLPRYYARLAVQGDTSYPAVRTRRRS